MRKSNSESIAGCPLRSSKNHSYVHGQQPRSAGSHVCTSFRRACHSYGTGGATTCAASAPSVSESSRSAECQRPFRSHVSFSHVDLVPAVLLLAVELPFPMCGGGNLTSRSRSLRGSCAASNSLCMLSIATPAWHWPPSSVAPEPSRSLQDLEAQRRSKLCDSQ